MNRLLLILSLFSFCFSTEAQTLLTGKILDKVDDKPIEYGSLILYNQSDSAMVDGAVSTMSGQFQIKEIKPGNYYLLVKFLGYESKTVEKLTLNGEEQFNLGSIYLEPNSEMLQELDITGDKLTALHQIDRKVYAAESFQNSMGGTAVDVIRNLPGAFVNANGDISIRGATNFLVMIDGRPLQSEVAISLNQLPANSIENVEIITAPSARYDAEGKAGIINIILKKGARDGLSLTFNTRVGLPSIEDYDNAEYAQRYGADVTLTYRKNKWDAAFGLSYFRNDISGRREGDVYTIINDTLTRFPSDGERSFDEYNVSGRFSLGFRPDKNNAFQLGINAGERSKDRTADILYNDNHAFVVPNGERLYTNTYFNENLRIRKGDFFLGSLDYAHTFGNKSELSTSFLYEYTLLGGPTTNLNLGWPNTNEVIQDEYNTNNNPLHGIRYQLDYTSADFDFGKLRFGYLFRSLDHQGEFFYARRNLDTDEFELVPEFSSTVNLKRLIHAVYGELSGSKGKWTYTAGARVEVMDRELLLQDRAGTIDQTFDYDFVKLYPSANLQYEFNPDLKLTAAYSKRVQRTTTFKMNPFPEREHSETLEQGDPNLRPEFIDLVEVGVVKNFGDQSVFGTVYYRDVQNLINRVNTIYNDTILNRIYSNVGTARTFGFETGTELSLTPWWSAFASFNIFRTSIEGSFDNRRVDTNSWMYNINLNTNVDITKTWSAQFTLNYLSDRITAQGKDSRFFAPNLTIRKTFGDGRFAATLQWLNIDMGLWDANEQRITTEIAGEFFTTTNYVYEVDMVLLNFTYQLNKSDKKANFKQSEFGEKEF